MAGPTQVLEPARLELDAEGLSCELIHEALEVIVLSPPFRTTRQCQNLLRYVVEKTLSGEVEALRERVIGVQVFGRPPTYDASQDPVVRIRAADVRRRLAQFYQSEEGGAWAVRIDVPPGSYRATFEGARQAPQLLPGPTPPAPRPAEGEAQEKTAIASVVSTSRIAPEPFQDDGPPATVPRSWFHRPYTWVVAAICALVLVASGALWLGLSRPAEQKSFEQFWAPMLRSSRPVLICMGSNVVYQMSHEFMVQYLAKQHTPGASTETFVDLPPDTLIHLSDVQRAKDSFVALGDVAAASRLVATLTQQGHSFQERFPPDISFAELQNNPTILIGGFNNPLTMALTKDLRYVLAQNSRVIDRQDPNKNWAIQFHGDARETEDYAIISRVLDSKTGGPVIVVAGIGQYGTQAAAEYVSNAGKIAEAVKDGPSNWNTKNMQVVLHVKVIDFRPVSTDVVGMYFW